MIIPGLPYVKLAAAGVVGVALAAGAWKVNSWRLDAADKAVAEGLLAEERRDREARDLAAAFAEHASSSAETAIASSSAAAEKVRIIYREAKRDDPDCAAWAAAPVACPLGDWLPAGARDPPRRVPSDPGEPDARLRAVSGGCAEADPQRRAGGGVVRLPGVREGLPNSDGGDRRACAVPG